MQYASAAGVIIGRRSSVRCIRLHLTADGTAALLGHNEQMNGISMPRRVAGVRPGRAAGSAAGPGPARAARRRWRSSARWSRASAADGPGDRHRRRARRGRRRGDAGPARQSQHAPAGRRQLGQAAASWWARGPNLAKLAGAWCWPAVSTAPLALRRLWPLTAFWLVLGVAVATPGYRATVVTLIAVVLAAVFRPRVQPVPRRGDAQHASGRPAGDRHLRGTTTAPATAGISTATCCSLGVRSGGRQRHAVSGGARPVTRRRGWTGCRPSTRQPRDARSTWSGRASQANCTTS